MEQTAPPTNPRAENYALFKEFTANHRLEVVRDDGLYRHLRMSAPGTGIWHWEITTWPGHLAVTGDIADGHVFARLDDMFEFFRVPASKADYFSDGAPSIDFGYWHQKLVAQPKYGPAKRFDSSVFEACVRQRLNEVRANEDLDDEEHQRLVTEAEVFGENEFEAYQWLAKESNGPLEDMLEHDFSSFDPHFLYACWAIVATIEAYDQTKEATR